MNKTSLHRSPFAVLGATIRDSRKRIMELAEEKVFELDSDLCQKARSDLTSPRARLSVETAWLPGVSPGKATQLLDMLRQNTAKIWDEKSIPALAHLNLMASAIELTEGRAAHTEVVKSISRLAVLIEQLSVDNVLRDINEDRSVSGFPEVRSIDQVEGELTARKRYYRTVIKDALEQYPTEDLVRMMNEIVEISANASQAIGLINDLVDSYEVEAQGFIEKETENVRKILAAVQKSISSGTTEIANYLSKLEQVLKNWSRVVKPIQVSHKVRGIRHEASQALAYDIRSLSIDLFRDHGMKDQVKKLIELLQNEFKEVPAVIETLNEDFNSIVDYEKFQKESAEQNEEWERSITYSTEIGMIFKERLSISPDGITWKQRKYPLKSITQVRWGAVRNSVNGIPTGTTYHLVFGDNKTISAVSLRRDAVFSELVDKLWRAVGVRLLTELLEVLKNGDQIIFGDATLVDDGVALVDHRLMGSKKPVFCAWHQVKVWSSNGSLYIGDAEDKKTYVELSYLHSPNTHILDNAIRLAFKKPGMLRLSELLD